MKPGKLVYYNNIDSVLLSPPDNSFGIFIKRHQGSSDGTYQVYFPYFEEASFLISCFIEEELSK